MAERVVPIKKSEFPEVETAYLHDSVSILCNSKVLSHATAPGIKMHYDGQTKNLLIRYKGTDRVMPDTNVKLFDYKK